jgi:D-galacturonate reductase
MSQTKNTKLDVVLVGGGMITHDQLLPSIYHLQRDGVVGDIKICALNSAPLRDLADDKNFARAFPGQIFTAYPDLTEAPENMYPDLFKETIAAMPAGNMVVVAVPDQFHYPVIKYALENKQHVLTVKPLVLKYVEAQELEKLACANGLFVGIEYHKRFDRRSLEARDLYQTGRFGELKCGECKLIEPWLYRHSNFQNWFTCENTDPFTYIGCHYVDLVYYITSLRPTEVSVRGVKGKFPNGNEAYMWTSGRVTFENGALLGVMNGLGYPDHGAGSNDQGMTLHGEGDDVGSIIKHNDQFRGVSHGYTDNQSGAAFRYINPDYMRIVPWAGAGLRPVGYGYDSIEASVLSAAKVNTADSLAQRQAIIKKIDDQGLIATPANSFINELTMEAGRLSILNDGQPAQINYGPTPSVELR